MFCCLDAAGEGTAVPVPCSPLAVKGTPRSVLFPVVLASLSTWRGLWVGSCLTGMAWDCTGHRLASFIVPERSRALLSHVQESMKSCSAWLCLHWVNPVDADCPGAARLAPSHLCGFDDWLSCTCVDHAALACSVLTLGTQGISDWPLNT